MRHTIVAAFLCVKDLVPASGTNLPISVQCLRKRFESDDSVFGSEMSSSFEISRKIRHVRDFIFNATFKGMWVSRMDDKSKCLYAQAISSTNMCELTMFWTTALQSFRISSLRLDAAGERSNPIGVIQSDKVSSRH